jgi:hypothetical protein
MQVGAGEVVVEAVSEGVAGEGDNGREAAIVGEEDLVAPGGDIGGAPFARGVEAPLGVGGDAGGAGEGHGGGGMVGTGDWLERLMIPVGGTFGNEAAIPGAAGKGWGGGKG